MKNNVAFISGHLSLTRKEFIDHYKDKIDDAIEQECSFVVGDAKGADYMAQQYLKDKTPFVTVYHMFGSPRNNVGYETKGGFKSDIGRDTMMTLDSNFDIAWVRSGREDSGTAMNLKRREKV